MEYDASKPISENPITHIGFIVDSSGSMHTNNLYKNVTEKGVDEFLQEQKKIDNEVLALCHDIFKCN